MRAEMAAMGESVREQGANLIVLGDDVSSRAPAKPGFRYRAACLNGSRRWWRYVPGQLLAYHLTLARGSDPDQPRTIRKVTLTRYENLSGLTDLTGCVFILPLRHQLDEALPTSP